MRNDMKELTSCILLCENAYHFIDLYTKKNYYIIFNRETHKHIKEITIFSILYSYYTLQKNCNYSTILYYNIFFVYSIYGYY